MDVVNEARDRHCIQDMSRPVLRALRSNSSLLILLRVPDQDGPVPFDLGSRVASQHPYLFTWLNYFRTRPFPKGKVPGSDSCPEPPGCFGEYAWVGGCRALGRLVLTPVSDPAVVPVLMFCFPGSLLGLFMLLPPMLMSGLTQVFHVAWHTHPGADLSLNLSTNSSPGEG